MNDAGDVSPRVLVVRPVAPTSDRTMVEHGVRAGFGVVAVVAEIVLQSLVRPDPARTEQHRAPDVVDAALGVGWGFARLAGRVVDASTRVAGPVVGVALDPPLVPRALRPGTTVDALAARWRADRDELAREAVAVSGRAVPVAVDSVAQTVDLDLLVRSVLAQLDLDDLVTEVLRRLDLDRAAGQVVESLDLTPILTEAVRRVDLQPVVTAALDELDLAAVVEQALAQIDLTAIVTEQVDLGAVVNAALDELDLTALVMERVDLVGVADYVVDEIDLPGIVRESTGSIAGESVRAVRLQAVDADRALARIVDRFTLRGGRARRVDAPGEPRSGPRAAELGDGS